VDSRDHLRGILLRIDGKGYKAYKAIQGGYDFGSFVLFIDHVQGDPFASPSRVRALVDLTQSGIPPELYRSQVRSVALRDHLARIFDERLKSVVRGQRGMGKSGLISIDRGGQEIIDRTAVVMSGGNIETRFVVGLPAAGRTILGREALEVFFDEIPKVVQGSLFAESLSLSGIRDHVETVENQKFLRDRLDDLGLVAFVGNGSILPRKSGVDDRPMQADVVSFRSPPELEMEVDFPNQKSLKGMGVPRGVTLIVGGGFHGKSTLLHAIERGVYDHLPGDGREFVVTHSGATKIRAENGRHVEKVNIEPFISQLPMAKETKAFSTENASGSTSQAANILEALEVGAKVLLVDEDTSATNFMIRDQRMQALVAKDKEPITPFVDKVRRLYEEDPDFNCEWKRVMVYESAEIPMDHEIAEVVSKYTEKVIGHVPPPGGTIASTDQRNFINDAGIPAITWGPGWGKSHEFDEYVEVSQVVDCAKILVLTLLDLLR